MPPLLHTDGEGSYITARKIEWCDLRIPRMIVVPRGFETDLASVPRIFWSILAPTGKHARAAIIHDFLYSTGGAWRKNLPADRPRLTRRECDAIFHRIMQNAGVRITRRWLMWLAVRICGWLPWHLHRRRREREAAAIDSPPPA